jgi:hypothetical protein
MVRQRHAVVAVRGDRLALTRLEVGTADVNPGAPQDEMLRLVGLDEERRIALLLWFDVEDIDAAIAELDNVHARSEKVHTPALLENSATRANDRVGELFANGRWNEIGALFADDVRVDDRRRGLQRESNDHATEVANLRAVADLGIVNISATPLALRGNRLCLSHVTLRGRDEFGTETLAITEVDHGLIVTMIAFDPDDVDAAYEELEARYLAGEAAPYAHVWQVGMETLDELNRHEPGPMVAELVYTDHRRVPFAPGDFGRAVEELWALVPDASYRTTAVYALDAHGTVVKFIIEGTDIHGSELQWLRVLLLSVGREETRLEVYEEDDVGTALARFEELRPQVRRLENAASRAVERYLAHFAPRDWDGMAEMAVDDFVSDDRRRVVNAGVRRGRDGEIANLQAIAEIGCVNITSIPIATRGERLVLARHSFNVRDWPAAFDNEMIDVVEIDSHERIVAEVAFDSNNIDAALAELDARYFAGEAAAHGNVWQPLMDTVGELNRHEPGPMLRRLAYADHRRVPFGSGEDYGRAIEELWTLVPDARYWTKAVHALDAHGLVSTLVIEGTDAHGNELQWGRTFLLLSDGPRVEVYEDDHVDTALNRFEELRPRERRIQNSASQAAERYLARYAARDWDALTKVLAADIVTDDRRRVMNAGIRHGRDAEIASLRAYADAGITHMTFVVIAARGERLILVRASGAGGDSGEFRNELLGVVEINSHNQIAALVVFDLDDFDSAINELDARYLAGEAAAHARTWSVITQGYAAQARRELPAMTPDCVTIDHRRAKAFASGEMTAYIRAGWDLDQTIRTYVEVVHRLSDLGAVCTYGGHGVSHEGFDAEWREIALTTVEGDMANRCELFDEADLDEALVRFDQLSRPAPRLQNAASRVYEHFWTCFAARDWVAMAEIFADDSSSDDRRRVVNAGIRRGRDTFIADMRAVAEVGTADNITSRVIATRGERLTLNRIHSSALQTELLNVVEINADERTIASVVVFDVEGIDAAFEELDARYIAGEAAAHARTWSLVTGAFAAINRHELPELIPDWVNVDHRHGAAFAPGDMTAFVHDLFEDAPDINVYIAAVHRLSNLGVVVTHRAHGTSQEGFQAEWQEIGIFTFDGDQLSRCELFDEADLDTALARFDQLSRPAPRLENAAARVYQRILAHFAGRDWAAIAEILAEYVSTEDRRRVVNAGLRHGRDAVIAEIAAIAEIGIVNLTSDIIATRGDRLVLSRGRASEGDQRPDAFRTDLLDVVEIDVDERVVARVIFDPDDFDAAFAELDARYLAGEAAAHAHMWSWIMAGHAALNRQELPPITPDCVSIDHRLGTAFAPGELVEYLRAGWDLKQTIRNYVEVVHRLSDLGAIWTDVGQGVSDEGFDAEWRTVDIMTIEGDMVNRCEIFDEADLDAALARFDQLSRPAPRLENAATRAYERLMSYVAARDWDAVAQITSENVSIDDRRRVVNAGTVHGRDAAIADTQATVDVGFTMTMVGAIATRGEHIALLRVRVSGRDPETIQNDALNIVEIDAEERIVADFVFDLEDSEAAFAELDARYIAGKAAARAHTWSVIARTYAGVNRQELPVTPQDWVDVDHRHVTALAPGDWIANLRAAWEQMPDLRIYIEAVHRLTNLGAVFSFATKGTSKEGFEAEWRTVNIMTVEGDLIDRSEIFDEADLDAALARFEELHPSTPRLENAASQAIERFQTCFTARDWDAMAEMMAEDVLDDDRRPVVNAGVRRGRDAEIANMQAIADIGAEKLSSTVVAIRGERLVLLRQHVGNDELPEAFQFPDVLQVVEIGADERFAAVVTFDLGDIDSAFAELESRYTAGEGAPCRQAWSVVTAGYAALNRHEVPPTTPDWVNVDHRRGIAFASGELAPYIRATFDVAPDIKIRIEVVHRLTSFGAVISYSGHGTSREGFDAVWRETAVFIVDGDLVSRCEMYDETDIDAALARFEELHPQRPRLENAVSRTHDRLLAYFAARNWTAIGEILADDACTDDRRRVVNSGVRHGRDEVLAELSALADVRVKNLTSEVIATRGGRLVLRRSQYSGSDEREAYHIDGLELVEADADQRLVARVAFDLDDIEAAFTELDARYLAGEAAAHAGTWSLIAGAFVALNRREFPATTPDPVSIDHRRVASFAPGEGFEYIRAGWDLDQNLNIYIETTHRINDLGAVFTWTGYGTSHDGFEAEWRGVNLMTVDGELLDRSEVFDEADLDGALARFEELCRPTPRLENSASRVDDRFVACLRARDWVAMADILTDDTFLDDRRRVVGIGVRQGRDVQIADFRAAADRDITPGTTSVIATRGERLALSRVCVPDRDQRPGAFHSELLDVVEIDTAERIVARFLFDVDDIDAAFAKLDARYLAGEAAAHAHTWSVIAEGHAGFNRQELAATTPDVVYIDRRPVVSLEGVELGAAQRAVWDLTPDANAHVEAVHRLSELGAVITQAVTGTSQEGFDAEWRMIAVCMVEGDLLSRYEVFDQADLDAALARFEELQPQARRLENAASRVAERFLARFVARDWDVVTEMLADDVFNDDRRRVVSAGVRQGREATIASMRASAALGLSTITSVVIATRGERLALSHDCFSIRDRESEEVVAEVLGIFEIDADERIVARLAFELDDIDAAFEELDARYLAGEAAAHAHMWTLIAGLYAGLNRHELPQTTPDFVDADHRRLAPFAQGDIIEFARTAFDQIPDLSFRIEAVHGLSNLGAVVAQALRGTSRDGFEAEWHEIHLTMVDGDRFSRSEIFDEADIDAALARFEELQPQAPRLENATTQIIERYQACFTARDWAAFAELVADDIVADDRRRVVNAGVRRGRDVHIADMRATVEVSAPTFSSSIIATRGERLALAHVLIFNRGMTSEVGAEMLSIVEIDADQRIAALVTFDLDDVEAAFEELDARYLAGEAAVHAHTWSVIAEECAAFNRHEVTAVDYITVDHRPLPIIEAFSQAALRVWEVTPDFGIHAEAVHQLSGFGAVATYQATGTSPEGFDGEWRIILLLTVEGDRINCCEVFDESDLDAALARFEELQPRARRLENAATQVAERLRANFAARDWTARAELLADDCSIDDRRRVVNGGNQQGRDADIANMRAIAAVGVVSIALTTIATRGERLALSRARMSGRDQRPEAFYTETLTILEIDTNNRATAQVVFDPDDIDAALAELDARYLAGEAAAHADTWSVIAGIQAAVNRRELPPMTPDPGYIDHRPLVSIEGADLAASIRAVFDIFSAYSVYVEAVHRLDELGAVYTQVHNGTSHDGFDAELRMIEVQTVEGDLVSRAEVFDEADLDAAVARFEELHPQPPRLENAATQVVARFWTYFETRDWDAMAETLVDDFCTHDRRRVVNAGVLRGRAVHITNMRAVAEVGFEGPTSTVIATRGQCLAFIRIGSSVRGSPPGEVIADVASVVEIDPDGRLVAAVMFDADDIDAAFEELDARYLAGEAAAHRHTWSVIAGLYAGFNRHQLPATTPDWTYIDHRPLITVEASDLPASIRAIRDLTPDIGIYMESVHRLSDVGAVMTHTSRGISNQDFVAEWRLIAIFTVDGELINRCEMFDETDLDAALERFDELHQPPLPQP